ncbi:MAG: UDP-N-acetylmuramoyl-L-alanyl-D-glutamate--2,6-diaminopimelate ligase [Candidatus Solibacter sp.]|nr:UDP-N-acetylmuramoyl-L-alanyl-D-glutamate--2,6-diaminopimelate ligase [Candidatus Solibacter sp.]
MKTLGELFPAPPLPADIRALPVSGLEYDSRKAGPGSVFFAFKGSSQDGRAFAPRAVERGAVAVVSESEAPAAFPAPWLQVPHGRRALAEMARRFFDCPDTKIRLAGVTGTNGKTTTAYLIDQSLRALGRKTGMVGTVEYRVLDEVRPAVNTTPESVDLVRIFAEVAAGGGTDCVLEVSSHALALGRVHGLDFHTAVFSNLTRDHLDFHTDMEEYFAAKCMLFAGAGGAAPRFVAINADDEWGARIPVAAGSEALTYGLKEGVSIRAMNVETGIGGLSFKISWRGEDYAVASKLTGLMNVYNLTAAFAALVTLDVDAVNAAQALSECAGAPGRFERVDRGQPFLVAVDYAHTDDALRNVIQAARKLTSARVIILFGCGGDRDRKKRPLMGRAAAEMSDYVVVTSDNPRSEDPLLIINDILVGVQKCETPYVVLPDRREAIRRAIAEARPGDVVILAGKGHEDYQVLNQGTIRFDDREVAEQTLASMGYAGGGERR